MENLISLIIDLLSALFSGSKNEKPGDASPPLSRPDPSRPRLQPRPTSWEEELRRLLDGQGQGNPAPPPQRPPPVVVPQALRSSNVPVARPASVESPAPIFQARSRPTITLPPVIETTSRGLASLSESQQAYTRASQIDKTAAARIERVPGQPVQLTTVTRRAVSAEIAEVVSLFKNARAARQAVIASAILGPPRAFEEQTSANF